MATSVSWLQEAGIDADGLRTRTGVALSGAEDGELFLESAVSESFLFDDGCLKSASFNRSQGFGLRAVCGEAVGYAHGNVIDGAAIARAGESLVRVTGGRPVTGLAAPPPVVAGGPCSREDTIGRVGFPEKTALLGTIDAWLRDRDPRVVQVSISLTGSCRSVAIIRPDGPVLEDVRPMARMMVSVVVESGGRRESGHQGLGGRDGEAICRDQDGWKRVAARALDQALGNLGAIPAPAGETMVALGPGWPGILLHEAVGHGLEGDFNRKRTSVFTGMIGERVAAPGVTVVDDGTLPDRRGSLNFDDEGTPPGRTVLIEDGVLVGYMHDRQSARLMNMRPTGNGRRESVACCPMPRMTNTFMEGGNSPPEEIIGSVRKGIYAVSFGGGQVDITSGQFVFSCTEAYAVENGKIGAPLKNATLIGSGAETLKRITMIGNDMALDPGIGTCGKAGQGVPVSVGQPTLLLSSITVGGSGV